MLQRLASMKWGIRFLISTAGAISLLGISTPVAFASKLEIEARKNEARCQQFNLKDQKIDCFEQQIEWWFRFGKDAISGNPHLEISRLLKQQLALDAQKISSMQQLAKSLYMVESRQIVLGEKSDFSTAIIHAFSDYESANQNTFEYWVDGIESLKGVIEQKNLASTETKRIFINELERRYRNAARLAKLSKNSDELMSRLSATRKFLGFDR